MGRLRISPRRVVRIASRFTDTRRTAACTRSGRRAGRGRDSCMASSRTSPTLGEEPSRISDSGGVGSVIGRSSEPFSGALTGLNCVDCGAGRRSHDSARSTSTTLDYLSRSVAVARRIGIHHYPEPSTLSERSAASPAERCVVSATPARMRDMIDRPVRRASNNYIARTDSGVTSPPPRLGRTDTPLAAQTVRGRRPTDRRRRRPRTDPHGRRHRVSAARGLLCP